MYKYEFLTETNNITSKNDRAQPTIKAAIGRPIVHSLAFAAALLILLPAETLHVSEWF